MIRDKRIALDFEGVCADTMGATLERSDILTREHCQQWGFPTEDVAQEFFDLSQTICEEHIEEVEPCDPDLADHVDMLRESHEVQILTNRHGCDDQLKHWLDIHGVEYDDFQSNPMGTDKSAFEKDYDNPEGFDFFIDDSPTLAHDVGRLFLVDQPWNQDVEADDKYVIRVGNEGEEALLDVVNDMYAGPVRADD